MKLRQLADNLDGAGYQVPLATAETDTSATPSDQAAPPGDGLWQQFVGLFDRQDEPATEPPASAPVATVTDAPLTDFTITEDNRVIAGTERAQHDPPCDTDKNSGPAKCGRRRHPLFNNQLQLVGICANPSQRRGHYGVVALETIFEFLGRDKDFLLAGE